MPKWVFHNPTKSLVHLPAPLHGVVRPGRNLEVITQAVQVDTPAMQALIKKGLLQVDAVIESSTINDKIEVPVVDFSEASLKFRYDWDVSVQYVMYDVVQDGGASWVALAPSLGTVPVEGPLWTFLGGGSGGGGGGITEPQHEALHTLVHGLNATHEDVPTFDSDGVISSMRSQEVGGAVIIRDVDMLAADSDGLVTSFRVRQRDVAGVVNQTLTGAITITAGVPTLSTVTRT